MVKHLSITLFKWNQSNIIRIDTKEMLFSKKNLQKCDKMLKFLIGPERSMGLPCRYKLLLEYAQIEAPLYGRFNATNQLSFFLIYIFISD